MFSDIRLSDITTQPSTDHSAEEKATIATLGNHVYFYADVEKQHTFELIKQLREVDEGLRWERLQREDAANATPIWLHIQSPGGSLFAGLAAADQIAAIQTPVYSVIEGLCASAATLLSLACTKRYITPSSFMLVHQFSADFWGKHEDFKDEMNLQAMLIDRLISFYTAKTKMDKKQVKKLLKRESWFDAKQAVELGLVDGIK